MRLLTATAKGQGERKNDFCWVAEGEILHFGSECDHEHVDGKCGCRRSMVGIDSHKATTTMVVRDIEITETQLFEKLVSFYTNDWKFEKNEAVELAKAEIKDLVSLGETFRPNIVIEKRGKTFQTRITKKNG